MPNPFVPPRPAGRHGTWEESEAAFRAIGERRGVSGLDGLLAYWRAHAELCGAIVERLDLPTLVLEVGADEWPERRRRICNFLDVPFEEDPPPTATDAARVTGRYRDGKREVTIEVVDGRLILRGVLWFANALLPVARNVFDVESWPLRVVFEEDAAGLVSALRLAGSRLSWGAPEGVFARI